MSPKKRKRSNHKEVSKTRVVKKRKGQNDEGNKSQNDEWDRIVAQVNQTKFNLLSFKKDEASVQACKWLRDRNEDGYREALLWVDDSNGINFDLQPDQNILHHWASGLYVEFLDTDRQYRVMTPLWEGFVRNGAEQHVNELCARSGAAPLHYAFGWGCIVAVTHLLSLSATDLNVLSTKGLTPLMHALEQGKNGLSNARFTAIASCIYYVLDNHYARIDLNVINKEGKTIDTLMQEYDGLHKEKICSKWVTFKKWINNHFYPAIGQAFLHFCQLPPDLHPLLLSYLYLH